MTVEQHDLGITATFSHIGHGNFGNGIGHETGREACVGRENGRKATASLLARNEMKSPQGENASNRKKKFQEIPTMTTQLLK